ncbi:hypothetical protein C4573_05265 [Candidatus Woesearchaeota archaeon]|nr:MAG: hypothetical protein C4573_05265 [Candidatus Woesearchaeota archaeon]
MSYCEEDGLNWGDSKSHKEEMAEVASALFLLQESILEVMLDPLKNPVSCTRDELTARISLHAEPLQKYLTMHKQIIDDYKLITVNVDSNHGEGPILKGALHDLLRQLQTYQSLVETLSFLRPPFHAPFNKERSLAGFEKELHTLNRLFHAVDWLAYQEIPHGAYALVPRRVFEKSQGKSHAGQYIFLARGLHENGLAETL